MEKDPFPASIYNEFSPSKIISIENCPLQGILKYVFRVEADTPVELALGKVLHLLFSEFFKKKNGFQSAEKFAAYGVKYWEDIFNEPIRVGDNPNVKELQIGLIIKILKKFYEQNIFFRDLYDVKHRLVKEKIKPTPRIEIRLEADFREIVPGVKLIGVLDRIQPTENGEMEIWDNKTGSYKPRKEFLDMDVQLTSYQFLYEANFHSKPKALKLYLCRDGILINAKIRGHDDYNYLANKILIIKNTLRAVVEVIKGIRPLNNPLDESKISKRGGIHCGTCYYPELCANIQSGKNLLGKIEKVLKKRKGKSNLSSRQLELF